MQDKNSLDMKRCSVCKTKTFDFEQIANNEYACESCYTDLLVKSIHNKTDFSKSHNYQRKK